MCYLSLSSRHIADLYLIRQSGPQHYKSLHSQEEIILDRDFTIKEKDNGNCLVLKIRGEPQSQLDIVTASAFIFKNTFCQRLEINQN